MECRRRRTRSTSEHRSRCLLRGRLPARSARRFVRAHRRRRANRVGASSYVRLAARHSASRYVHHVGQLRVARPHHAQLRRSHVPVARRQRRLFRVLGRAMCGSAVQSSDGHRVLSCDLILQRELGVHITRRLRRGRVRRRRVRPCACRRRARMQHGYVLRSQWHDGMHTFADACGWRDGHGRFDGRRRATRRQHRRGASLRSDLRGSRKSVPLWLHRLQR